ncbi:unnamed protein product [Clavelina lepadiformis]|uniref:Uncharacterized protein n=1 Tax=Clavelina lepadiformis TaxID=159417 RepID=A0ABP0FUD0_CLALP
MCDFIYFIYALSTVVVAGWLRRQTRNLLGPASVGSNPADNADITFAISYGYSEMWHFIYFIYALGTVVVAEWLRRQTRNLLSPARGVSGGYSYYSGKIVERRSTSCRGWVEGTHTTVEKSENVDRQTAGMGGGYSYYSGKIRERRSTSCSTVVVAVWLRRQTRNLLGHARVGSNPADNADITFAISNGYSEMCDFIYFIYALSTVVVAEWLRRQTRNLLGPASVGSNPADNADITFAISYGYSEMWHFIYFIYALGTVVVAEWLRRQTRNLLYPARGVSGGYSYYSGKIVERRSTSCSCRGGVVKATDSKSVGSCPRTVVVAEWLRRQTRNLLGHARVGSNPADNADITFAISYGYSKMWHFIYFIYALCTVVVAEWLRRQTRNLLGLARVGSNPADNADITFAISYEYSEMHCGRGGVVKATDSKSVGPSPRTFKSRRQSRYYFCNFIWILHLHMNMKPGGGWRVLILQWKNRRTSIDKLQVQTSEPQSDEPTTV